MKTINIKGDIVDNDWGRIYEWIGWDYMSPSKMESELAKANGDEVVFLINSCGGSVFDGYDIFNAIKDYKGKTTAKIVGLAASAASFIAMAADKVQACALSQMMIHRASNANTGNAPSHYANGDFLEGVDNTIVKAYTMRNGKTDEEMIELMDKTTWLTPTQAKENGIVDEIVNDTIEKPLIINGIESDRMNIVKQLFGTDKIENIKKIILENQKQGQKVVNSAIDNKQTEEGETKMTLDQFKSENADLYNQIVQDATEEAVKNERDRIAGIYDLSKPGIENQIKEGIINGLTAGEVAINIVKNTVNSAQEELKAHKEDAKNSGMYGVEGSQATQNENDKQEAINLLANAGKSIVGGNR